MSILKRAFKLGKNINARSLEMLIFFVTSRCNARCGSCFYWENLNSPVKDLSLDEITKLTISMSKFKQVLFSGGEPFLRDDLYDIVALFHRNAGVKIFSFPTNGTLADHIYSVIGRILNDFPNIQVSVNFSLDGPPAYHDKMRRIPNCFEAVKQSIELLRPLRKIYGSRLGIRTNTVINSENSQYIEELLSFMEKEYNDLDDNLFELLRGEPLDRKLKEKIPAKELLCLFRRIREYRIKSLFANNTALSDIILKLANLILLQNAQFRSYNLKNGWGPCLAGKTICVLDYNGNLRHCELRRPVVLLREYGMNFLHAWHSQASVCERKDIDKAGCWNWCTHNCFINYSLFHDYKTYFIMTPIVLGKALFEVIKYRFRT